VTYVVGQKLTADELNHFTPTDITFGGDTNLLRSAAAVLRTDGDFEVMGGISVPRGMLMRGRRDTASTTTTTIVGVLRLDDQAILLGRGYEIAVSGIFCTSTVNNDRALVSVRHTTDGSTPTTSSTVIPAGESYQIVTVGAVTGEDSGTLLIYYAPAANQTLSLLVCVARNSGTGSVGMFADGTHKLDISIKDVGAAKTDTGTDI
jgi:hypothetical protein